jgi:hypothetical protein
MATPMALPLPAISERRFFTGMALAILATVFLGFSRSFFLRPMFPDWPSPHEPFFYVHGAFFTGWILLLVVQATLVARGRTDLHRKVGAYGVGLAMGMVVLGTLAALIAARRPGGFVGVPVPPLQFLFIPLFSMVSFPAFVAAAVLLRRDPQTHKRLMVLATVQVITAAIARWPVISGFGPPAFFGVTDLFIVALAVWDFRTRGKLHPATLWGGLITIAFQPVQLVVSGTAAWLDIARWATGLLG